MNLETPSSDAPLNSPHVVEFDKKLLRDVSKLDCYKLWGEGITTVKSGEESQGNTWVLRHGEVSPDTTQSNGPRITVVHRSECDDASKHRNRIQRFQYYGKLLQEHPYQSDASNQELKTLLPIIRLDLSELARDPDASTAERASGLSVAGNLTNLEWTFYPVPNSQRLVELRYAILSLSEISSNSRAQLEHGRTNSGGNSRSRNPRQLEALTLESTLALCKLSYNQLTPDRACWNDPNAVIEKQVAHRVELCRHDAAWYLSFLPDTEPTTRYQRLACHISRARVLTQSNQLDKAEWVLDGVRECLTKSDVYATIFFNTVLAMLVRRRKGSGAECLELLDQVEELWFSLHGTLDSSRIAAVKFLKEKLRPRSQDRTLLENAGRLLAASPLAHVFWSDGWEEIRTRILEELLWKRAVRFCLSNFSWPVAPQFRIPRIEETSVTRGSSPETKEGCFESCIAQLEKVQGEEADKLNPLMLRLHGTAFSSYEDNRKFVDALTRLCQQGGLQQSLYSGEDVRICVTAPTISMKTGGVYVSRPDAKSQKAIFPAFYLRSALRSPTGLERAIPKSTEEVKLPPANVSDNYPAMAKRGRGRKPIVRITGSPDTWVEAINAASDNIHRVQEQVASKLNPIVMKLADTAWSTFDENHRICTALTHLCQRGGMQAHLVRGDDRITINHYRGSSALAGAIYVWNIDHSELEMHKCAYPEFLLRPAKMV